MQQRPSIFSQQAIIEVKLGETRTGHFERLKLSSRSERINKLDRDFSYWQILALVCPRDIAYISAIFKRVQNKVYYLILFLHGNSYGI